MNTRYESHFKCVMFTLYMKSEKKFLIHYYVQVSERLKSNVNTGKYYSTKEPNFSDVLGK